MDFFIKKIFDGNSRDDELLHLQFQKFSRGNFKDRGVVIAKNIKGRVSISTTYEYANEFVRALAEKLGNNKTNVTGVVVSTRNLENEIDFRNKKQFMGIKQYVIDKEMSGNEILELCNKLPSSFIGLSFNVNGSELKIKTKAPKSTKPSTKGEGSVKADFCKLKTSDMEIVDSLIFDAEAKSFNNIEIKHNFIIDEIIISDKLKKECGDDFARLRELAVRKGKIIRKMNIDGNEVVKE
ncbi:MAG: hypothetical protein AABX77_00875, partial [Nanoarchaeota archaeon]